MSHTGKRKRDNYESGAIVSNSGEVPISMLYSIFEVLDPDEWMKPIRLVCKTWNAIVNRSSLWSKMFREIFGVTDRLPVDKTAAVYYRFLKQCRIQRTDFWVYERSLTTMSPHQMSIHEYNVKRVVYEKRRGYFIRMSKRTGKSFLFIRLAIRNAQYNPFSTTYMIFNTGHDLERAKCDIVMSLPEASVQLKKDDRRTEISLKNSSSIRLHYIERSLLDRNFTVPNDALILIENVISHPSSTRDETESIMTRFRDNIVWFFTFELKNDLELARKHLYDAGVDVMETSVMPPVKD